MSRHQTLAAALFLALVLHVCFFPFILGNKTLLAGSRGVPSVMPSGAFYGGSQGPTIYRGNDMGAPAWVMEADAPLVRHQYLGEKHLPLWNPYQSYGTPLAANMQSQPFNPLFVLYALHPGPRTFNLFILIRFLIAGLCAYLYLRLFLPFAPSLAGGLVTMLSGYYILFFNMPHLSVDVLVPAVFLAIERLLRQHSTRNVLLAILVVFLTIVGGMPETTLLILTFGYVYFFFRSFTDLSIRSAWRTHFTYFLFVNVIGFALAAFLLGPFVEFLRISFDMHQIKNIGHSTGLEHDRLGLSIFTYVMPMLFGTAWKTIAPSLGGYTALRDFFGILPVLFAIIAVCSVSGKTHRRLIMFFSSSVVFLFLKRYGAPVINWIGYLPLFRVVWFPKYEEPLLAFGIAVLCAIGLDRVLSAGISRRRLTGALWLAFLVLAAIVAISLPIVLAANAETNDYYLSLGGTVAILFIATLLLLGSAPSRVGLGAGTPTRAWLAAGVLLLLTCEAAGNYIYPVYYILTASATDDTNPYRGAPYIDFLKANVSANERIFGGDLILHPDWAGSFQLADIRGLDAMYYQKYLRFVRYFLHEEMGHAPGGDLVERFTGGTDHFFDTSLKRRLLQLSSVRYLLSLRPFAPDSVRVHDILAQNTGRLAAGKENLVEMRRFTIGGETKAVLYEHPSYDRLPFRIEISRDTQRFYFNIAMDPAVYDGHNPICGDGVEFRLEARDSGGRISPLYDRYIDPKQNPAERKWIAESVDLGAYMGQQIDLLFTTTPGPVGNSCMDWAGWGDPHFNGDAAAQPVFRLMYDHEIKIYEYADRLPRAAVYSTVETSADDEAALAKLGSPALDISQTAVVSLQGVNAEDAAAVRSLGGLLPERVRAARILSYTSQEVKIDASAERPSLLVLNDSDYPGWKVYVDGRRSRWITTNYLFRGVLLTPGRHLVRFAYEPASFAAGAVVSSAGLLCLAGFVVWRRRGSGVAKSHFVQ